MNNYVHQYITCYNGLMSVNTEKILGSVSNLVAPYTVPILIMECDFFNNFNKYGAGDLTYLSNRFGFDERVFDTVLHYLVKEKYLEKRLKDGNHVFELSDTSKEFLLRDSKYDLSIYVSLLVDVLPRKIGASIISALKTGVPAKWNDGGSWEEQMKSGDISRTFSQGMMSRGKYLMDLLSPALQKILINRKKLIDVGGSLGDYCGRFTSDFDDLDCTVFDLEKVIIHAKENVSAKNYQRISFVSGDMFKDSFPTGYDAFFYSNAIHDWDMKQNKYLFDKTYKALSSKGVIIIHDCHLANDKTGPDWAVDHSLYLSVFTHGRYYSRKEISDLLLEVGFKNIEIIETVAGISAIIGYKNE